MSDEIFVVAARRTAIGTFGGSLSNEQPCSLGSKVVHAALETARIPTGTTDYLIFRQSPTMNRLCGCSLQAIVSAANSIAVGDTEVATGCGTEIMSSTPLFAPYLRFSKMMGVSGFTDSLNGALEDPFTKSLIGVYGDYISHRYKISREKQDLLALESQRRAQLAINKGYFKTQIVPIKVSHRSGAKSFLIDEHVKSDTTLERLSSLHPIFNQGHGTVTVGNSAGINDGAAAVVLASRKAVTRYGLQPIARIMSYAHTDSKASFSGLGAVPATLKALSQAGLETGDIDVIETNETCAAQACAIANEIDLDIKRLNPNGSGVSLGRPAGAAGAIIATKLVHELQRTSLTYGLATMSIGEHKGIAVIFERI